MLNPTSPLSHSPEPEFYYCSIDDLRELGISAPPEGATGFVPETISDKRLQKLIKLASNRINTVTRQFFQPWPKEAVCNGTGVELIHTIEVDRIIEVETVFSASPGCTFNADLSFLVIKERFVASRNQNRHADERAGLHHRGRGSNLLKAVKAGVVDFDRGFIFHKGNSNWTIRGTFGDIKILPKLEVDLLQGISRGDTEIKVSDTDCFGDGESIVIGSHHFIINEIMDDETFRIDPSCVKIALEVPPNKVIRYGRIHDEIRDCAIRLVLDQIDGPLAVTNFDNGLFKVGEDYFCDSIIMEKTDNYTYNMSKLSREDRANNSLITNGTGNTYVDALLRRYHAPRYLGFV